jgi:WD40 repeat protein
VSATASALASPYKGLAPFEDSELDALLFFGRERETEIIVSNLLATKLTVLYGPSGVGKSSVLRAAVVRRLRELEPGTSVALVDDWTGAVDLPAADFLVLDQFEEYFLYHDAREGVSEALARSPAHVLIALREDQLAQLDAFQVDLPNVFANRLRLDHLQRSAARAAIVGPLDRWNAVVDEDDRAGIETALVDEVLDQVATGLDQVEAPYLQLVLERVWDEEQSSGSRVLRRAALERLGGAEAIVGAHLERALSALPPRDADIATNALRFLVTPSRTKIAHTLDDLVGYTNESPVVLQGVLERLAAQRVLRAGDGGRYEIFHDVLAEPLLAWRREREARAALAAAQRRHRRLAVVAGASLAVAAAMIALTVYAFSQRSEASKQRHQALVQKELAVGQKKIAQQLAEKERGLTKTAVHERRQAEAARRRAQVSAHAAKESAASAKHNLTIAQEQKHEADVSKAAAQRNADALSRSLVRQKRLRARAVDAELAARKQARIAKVGRLIATAEKDLAVDAVKSVQNALAASQLELTPRVEDALRDSLGQLHVLAIFDGGGGPLNAAVFSHDGSLVATAAGSGAVRIFDARTHKRRAAFDVGASADVVRFSPDDTKLAVGTDGKRAVIYDLAVGRIVQTLPHEGSIRDLAFAGNGRYLITASSDLSVRIWDVDSGALLQRIVGSASQEQVAVSPDGSEFAVRGRGQSVGRIYAVPSGALLGTVPQPGELTALAFSPDGRYLVTTGRRNGFVWNTTNWSPVSQLVGHEAAITDVTFTPDGHVVTSSIDTSARVWDPATGDTVSTLAAQHLQKVLAVAASPDGREIATASADNTARLWRGPSFGGSAPTVLGGHTNSVVAAAFSPDSSQLLTASVDGTARLWDTRILSLTPVGSQTGPINGVSFSHDGSLMLSAGSDGTARVYRGRTATTLVHGGKVVDAVFSPGGTRVLTSGDDGTAKLWRTDGTLLRTFVHGAPVTAAAFDGAGIVTAGSDGSVKAWRADGTLRWSASHGSPVSALAVSAGTVATGAADGSIRLWRDRDGRALGTLHGHTGAVNSLAFDRAGDKLASGGADALAFIWDVARRTALHKLSGHQFGVTSVVFSPDARYVLSAGVDGDARIWSVAKGVTVQPLKFHVSTVSQAAFSPDGKWAATAGPTTAAIWQVSTGRLLYALGGAKGNLTGVAWAPDSRRIVTGDTGGTVTTFDCTLCVGAKALRAQAVARLAAIR